VKARQGKRFFFEKKKQKTFDTGTWALNAPKPKAQHKIRFKRLFAGI
jgi:hypothetical protein